MNLIAQMHSFVISLKLLKIDGHQIVVIQRHVSIKEIIQAPTENARLKLAYKKIESVQWVFFWDNYQEEEELNT